MDDLLGKVAVLRKTDLFEDLTPDILQDIAHAIETKTVKKDTLLFREGDPSDGLYIIVSGEILLKKGTDHVVSLKERDFFGENGLLNNNPRFASAVAAADSRLFFLPSQDFTDLIPLYPELLWQITRKVVFNLEVSAKADVLVKPQSFYDAVLEKAKTLKGDSPPTPPSSDDESYILSILRETPLFSGVSESNLPSIAGHFSLRSALKGDTIFSAGDPSDCMYLIAEGAVVIKKSPDDLFLLNGHDFFGETGIVSNRPRSAAAIAVEDCKLLRMEKQDFDVIAKTHHSVAKSILFKIVSYLHPHLHIQTEETPSSPPSEPDRSSTCRLFLDRLGLNKSASISILDLYAVLSSKKVYQITDRGIEEALLIDPKIGIREPEKELVTFEPPEHAILKLPASSSVTVPVIAAEPKALSYYGLSLLSKNEPFKIDVDDFPIWNIMIGEHYLDTFVLSSQGPGWVFEEHRDKPHLHVYPGTEPSGVYLAAKLLEETPTEKTYAVTGFSIPSGSGIYTKRGSLHCDLALQGNPLAGYDYSSDRNVTRWNPDAIKISPSKSG